MKKLSTAKMTREEWLEVRKGSIGGSDAGTILGLNNYCHPARLFGEKAGLIQSQEAGDSAFFGTILEDTIADLMKYAPIVKGEVFMEGLKAYYEKKVTIWNITRSNYIIYHDKYPFISGNLDRIIADPFGRDKKYKGNGVLEIKTISGWNADKWEVGIPPQYFAQLQHYLAVTGYKWGMIAVLIDGRQLKVFEFERDDKLIEGMIEVERKFWENVEKAKALVVEGRVEEAWQFAPTDNEHGQQPNPLAYEAFLKERYHDVGNIMAGSRDDFCIAADIKAIDEKIKALEMERLTRVNSLKAVMGDASTLEFEDGSYISWRMNAKGVRVFNIKIK